MSTIDEKRPFGPLPLGTSDSSLKPLTANLTASKDLEKAGENPSMGSLFKNGNWAFSGEYGNDNLPPGMTGILTKDQKDRYDPKYGNDTGDTFKFGLGATVTERELQLAFYGQLRALTENGEIGINGRRADFLQIGGQVNKKIDVQPGTVLFVGAGAAIQGLGKPLPGVDMRVVQENFHEATNQGRKGQWLQGNYGRTKWSPVATAGIKLSQTLAENDVASLKAEAGLNGSLALNPEGLSMVQGKAGLVFELPGYGKIAGYLTETGAYSFAPGDLQSLPINKAPNFGQEVQIQIDALQKVTGLPVSLVGVVARNGAFGDTTYLLAFQFNGTKGKGEASWLNPLPR